ncbi:hypothetical protein DCAR_0100415 [Daucus carota subsp. sativus]|uniref:Uncharacterized protein n=1 Tax=Daucus carota subsp. sativus TaxID=79200 RepID=A0A166FMW6_DAUCS|nr:hypothetical protein DCAR_0100415 [Daucus carota subsp. sativus]
MNNVSPATGAEQIGSRRSLPKRGQIKSRIATNALHSIVYVLSRAASNHHQSTGKVIRRGD